MTYNRSQVRRSRSGFESTDMNKLISPLLWLSLHATSKNMFIVFRLSYILSILLPTVTFWPAYFIGLMPDKHHIVAYRSGLLESSLCCLTAVCFNLISPPDQTPASFFCPKSTTGSMWLGATVSSLSHTLFLLISCALWVREACPVSGNLQMSMLSQLNGTLTYLYSLLIIWPSANHHLYLRTSKKKTKS